MEHELTALRLGILAALAGCADPSADWPVCGNEEELFAESYEGYESFDAAGGDVLVCGDLPADGSDCPDYREVNANEFFEANVGSVTSERGDSGYLLRADCGPETTRADACCYVIELEGFWQAGRPLVVNGRDTVAAVLAAPGWGPAAAGPLDPERATRWAAIARAEHASIAAFAYFTLELLALGAPAELVAESTRAQADEVDHARRAFALASAFAGENLAPGPLNVSRSVGHPDPMAVACALAREGCVAETASAAETALAIPHAITEAERATLIQITIDERRHAAFAWRAAQWLLGAFPEARAPFAHALAEASARAESSGPSGARIVREVVNPCGAALLA
ncbi:hypothetical protein LBMAG42_40350 [Deltaproteobacteria bacterium]|nr:hypothetical protein LBMAG42_40350 [Deltaproteobacteria bacterium]